MSMFGNLSANQINAGMGLGPGGVGDQSQALFNNLYGPQGFGGQTAAYAGAGAAYGRDTGGFGGYGGMNDPMSPVGGYNGMDATTGVMMRNGAIDQQDPGNIALYYQMMGGGGIPAAAPSPGYTPDATASQNGFGYPGGGSMGSMFDPNSYGSLGMGVPAQTGSGGLALNPNGSINQSDPGNIALYYQIMRGGGGAPQMPGQPYGQGYFDQTFGAANSQPQAYNPNYGGGYPGAMSSDYQAQQQQMIQDLYRTLGIIDNAGDNIIGGGGQGYTGGSGGGG